MICSLELIDAKWLASLLFIPVFSLVHWGLFDWNRIRGAVDFIDVMVLVMLPFV